MRALFLGKNKSWVVRGLDYLLGKEVEVTAVVAPQADARMETADLASFARARGVEVVRDRDLYDAIESDPERSDWTRDVDIVVSYLFSKRILSPLIELPRIACINFHPAPLPDYRGVAGYSFAILDDLTSWGVSAHHVAADFDTGDLIEVRRFPIRAASETALSLERRTQELLFELFTDVVEGVLQGVVLQRIPQGDGRYVSYADVESSRRVQDRDSPELIERKIRAFWFPPHGGAFIERDGKEYTLVDRSLLELIAACLSKET